MDGKFQHYLKGFEDFVRRFLKVERFQLKFLYMKKPIGLA
jgi:hypothetical protein